MGKPQTPVGITGILAGLVLTVGLLVGGIALALGGALLVMIASFIAKALGSLIALLLGLFALALVFTLMFGGIYLPWRDMFADAQPSTSEPPQQVLAELQALLHGWQRGHLMALPTRRSQRLHTRGGEARIAAGGASGMGVPTMPRRHSKERRH